ncbi:MAG: glycoside hydrolase family 73 protein [Verrucomicrobiota bacterium]
MPEVVNLTDVYWKKGFYKQPTKRIGLVGTLVLSNILWIVLFVIVVSILMGMSRMTSGMAKSYIQKEWELSRIKQLTARELADRDEKIERLMAFQSTSPKNILTLARNVSDVLDSAPVYHRDFFEKALPEAMLVQITYGIPASAVMAMSIYESAYGKSSLSENYHNYFGIKAFDDWKGARAVSMPTKDSGVATTADFRAYRSLREGFLGYAQFIKDSDRYQRAFRAKNGVQFVSALLRSGYCPDSSYLDNIEQLMERHHLLELDEALETSTHNPIQMASYKDYRP